MTDPLLSLLSPPAFMAAVHARLASVLPSRVHLLPKVHAPDVDAVRKRAKPLPGRGRGRPAVQDVARSCSVCGWHKEACDFRRGRMKCLACTYETWNALRNRKKAEVQA